MKTKFFFVSVMAILVMWSYDARADLANAMICYQEPDDSKAMCDPLLIGAIDAVYASQNACADGKTSYKDIIQTWRRDLRIHLDRREFKTVTSIAMTMHAMGLACTSNKGANDSQLK
jgi:hypothetical protein